MTRFKCEQRYIVLKCKDLDYLDNESIVQLNNIQIAIDDGRASDGKPPLNAVVVEEDWPEYEMVWRSIEARSVLATPTLARCHIEEVLMEMLANFHKEIPLDSGIEGLTPEAVYAILHSKLACEYHTVKGKSVPAPVKVIPSIYYYVSDTGNVLRCVVHSSPTDIDNFRLKTGNVYRNEDDAFLNYKASVELL
jgi:hypothetical protein